MNISLWSALTLIDRVALYACVASAIGGVFSSVLLARHAEVVAPVFRYCRNGCAVGLFTVLGSLLVKVGDINDSGFAGAFDLNMMSVILGTSVGQALILQLVGFLFIGACAWWSLRVARTMQTAAISALGSLLLAVSFSLNGHSADVGAMAQVAIVLHILAMSLWIGSLYPLWLVSRTADLVAIQGSMEGFGRVATFIVGVLVACGTLMAIFLLQDVQSLVSTNYGRGLLLKVLFVGTLLLLAGCNRWVIVPRLSGDRFVSRLSGAIVLEMVVAALILVTTGVLTILIGTETS